MCVCTCICMHVCVYVCIYGLHNYIIYGPEPCPLGKTSMLMDLCPLPISTAS